MSSVVLGVPVEDLTLTTTYDLIDELITDGRSSGRTHQVATVNVDFIVNALEQPELMSILRRSSINFADGMPLLWASRAMNTPLTERVAGSDLFAGLGEQSAKRGWDVHVLGGRREVGERALEILLEGSPCARMTIDPGPMIPDVTDVSSDLIDGLAERNPDVLCVALGNPKQELFIARYAERIGCPVLIGVGGSMDMMVGEPKRAPKLAQRLGLEWLHRAAQEPSRLGPRYFRDGTVFGPKVARELADARCLRSGTSFEVDLSADGIRAIPSDQLRVNRGRSSHAQLDLLTAKRPVEIQLDGVSELSWDGVAILVQLVRTAARFDSPLETSGASPETRRAIERHAIGPWLLNELGVRATAVR